VNSSVEVANQYCIGSAPFGRVRPTAYPQERSLAK